MTAPTEPHLDHGGHRAAAVLSSLAMLGYVGFLIWIAAGRPPIRMTGWHWTTRTLQAFARGLGRAGLAAEQAYNRARDTGTLAD